MNDYNNHQPEWQQFSAITAADWARGLKAARERRATVSDRHPTHNQLKKAVMEKQTTANELKVADDLLNWFSTRVEEITGWGTPTYDRNATSIEDAMELMQREVNHLDDCWSDMKSNLERSIYKKRQELGLRT